MKKLPPFCPYRIIRVKEPITFNFKKEVAKMYYTGIDLHRKTSFITTIDKNGQMIKRANLLNDEMSIINHLNSLNDKTRIVIESTASWYWLYDLLTENGFDVVISNPVKTKAIASARIKNDKLDSHMLAQLLRADLVATVHVSSQKTRQLKELLRHRSKLVRDTVRMKNRIHNIMAKNNFHAPFSDLFGIGGLEYLSKVSLPSYHRDQVQTYLNLYDCIKEQIASLTRQIHKEAKNNAMAKLLMTIPGVGPITAMFMVAEIEDISRFPSFRHLASYAGLVPCLDASADKHRMGHITKQGSPYLRTALVEAAQACTRTKSRLNIFFRRRIVRSGYQNAIVATAHRIIKYAYFILRDRTPYQDSKYAVA
jgi:transposase